MVLYSEAAEQLCGWKANEVAGQVRCYSLLGCYDADGGLLCHARCVPHAGALDGPRDLQARYEITCKGRRELMVEAHYSQLGSPSGATGCTLPMLRTADSADG